MLSILFVVIQFGTLGIIAISGPLIPDDPWLFVMESAGVLLGTWAVLTMGIGKFNITPEVKKNSRLVTTGPYSLIRHPMYTALLLTTLPLIINSFSYFRLFIWLLLLADLLLKMNYEEGLLRQAIPGYSEYMKNSYRIIPFVF